MNKKNIFKLTQDIKKGIASAENYNTGLIGEAMIVSAYKQMPIEKLESLRFIITKIIQQKKKINNSKVSQDGSNSALP